MSASRQVDGRTEISARRHEPIFGTDGEPPVEVLKPVNDHDLKSLYHQFAGELSRELVETGPETWRVRKGRPRSFDVDAYPQPSTGSGPRW